MANDCTPLVVGTQPISVDISFYVGLSGNMVPPKKYASVSSCSPPNWPFWGINPPFSDTPHYCCCCCCCCCCCYYIHNIYIYDMYIHIFNYIHTYSVNHMIYLHAIHNNSPHPPRSSRLGCAPRLSGEKWVPRRRWSSAAFPAQLSLEGWKNPWKNRGRTMGKHGNSEWVWACLWNPAPPGEYYGFMGILRIHCSARHHPQPLERNLEFLLRGAVQLFFSSRSKTLVKYIPA